MPSFKYDAFISYSRLDLRRVERIAIWLRERGARLWFDKWSIEAGESIPRAIDRALSESRCCLLFLSTASVGADWPTLERSAAIFRDPQNSERRFLPVLLEDVHLTAILAQYRYLDCRKPSGTAYQAILDSLHVGAKSIRESMTRAPLAITIHHVEDEPAEILWLGGALANYLELDGYLISEFTEISEAEGYSFTVSVSGNAVPIRHIVYPTPGEFVTALTLSPPGREILITDMMFGDNSRYANDGLDVLRIAAARIPADCRFILTAFPRGITAAAAEMVGRPMIFEKPPQLTPFVKSLAAVIRRWF